MWDHWRNDVRWRRGKKQTWLPHVRYWALSEANLLYWRKCLWHFWDFSAYPQWFDALRSDSAETKLQAPQIETWNIIESVEFLSIFRMSSPPRKNAKPPYWKLSGDGSESAKMFDFRRATVFCLRYSLLKHKMTRYSKIFGKAMARFPPWLRLWTCGL